MAKRLFLPLRYSNLVGGFCASIRRRRSSCSQNALKLIRFKNPLAAENLNRF